MRLGLLFILFFGSGACGLIYQVLWLRQLSLVFGVTVYAASTVLAAFMTGLALGSMSAGRVLAGVGRPLRVFAVAEILVGISALATPLALDAASALYAALYHLSPDSLAVLTAARLISSFAVLLVPTFLMGLTLPVLSASSLVRGSAFNANVGALYAINTAGAVTGAWLTGFYLIGAIGMQRSFLLGATLNIVIGLIALMLDRREIAPAAAAAAADARVAPAAGPRLSQRSLASVVAISGFVSLALEIVWFRMLVQYLAATTYAFTAMLTMVLAGIAIGGALAARFLRRNRDWVSVLAATQLVAGYAVLISAIFLGWSYGAGWRTSGEWQASAVAILPVSILMGLSFPIAIRIATAQSEHASSTAVAQRVGRIYALNVLGAIAGALLGGFVVLPALGVRRALIVLAALYGASALILLIRHVRRKVLLATVGAVAAGFAVLAVRVPDPFTAAYARRYGEDMVEFWRHEGVQTAVTVHASQFRRSLYLDGLHQANDGDEMVRLHRIIGHLPMVLHPAPVDALVIGLGGGATSGAVSQHPTTSVDVVELSDSVRQSARFFAHVNYDVLNQPNVRLRVDDGRNFLLLSGEQFDVITADIIQPTHAGAGNLYSREYFSLVRRALKDRGVALQWIGHRPAAQYKAIMRTFLEVFPDATLWLDGNLMLGTLQPLRLNDTGFSAARAHAVTARALDDIGLSSFATLVSWYTADANAMRAFVGAGPVLSDDQPLVEYDRSLPSDGRPLDLSTLRSDVQQIIGPAPQ